MSLVDRLMTRKCRGCDDADFHTHHLTWFWYLRKVLRWR